MNKLVSKNPVLRFKLGKKILKALWGIDLAYIDNPSVMTAAGHGPKISDVHTPTKQERLLGNNLAAIGMAGATGASGNLLATKTNVGSKILRAMPATESNPYYSPEAEGMMIGNLLGTPFLAAALGNKKVNLLKEYIPVGGILAMKLKYLGKQLLDIPVTGKIYIGSGGPGDYNQFIKKLQRSVITKPVNNRWVNGILKRDEIKDVRATQQMLKDAGFDIGKYGVDGKWGKDTENAYQQYLALKNTPIYEKTPEQTVDISSPSKVLNSTVVNQEFLTPELLTEQNIVNNNLQTSSNPFIPEQKVFARNGNYNRSQIRDYMRLMGLNPYSFSGSDRKALRQWLNGKTDVVPSNLYNDKQLNNLFVKPYGFKQGGQLVSKNPIKRFKNRK